MWLFLLPNAVSWHRPISSLLSCSFFFCCSLIIVKAEINGPTSGSWSWVNILEEILFSWSLCMDYQIFSLLSLFFFPCFQSLWLRIFLRFWLQSSVLSIIFTYFCSFEGFFSELQMSLFSSTQLFLWILPIGIFQNFLLFRLFFNYHIPSFICWFSLFFCCSLYIC